MIIRRLNSLKIPVLLVMIFILFGVTHLLGDEPELQELKPVKYVEVTQSDGKIEKLDYDTFTMSWILPITLRTHFAREDVQLKKEDIDEIYITIQYPHGWDEDKEDWLVKVFLVNDIEWSGFLHVSQYMVKGISSTTGEEKSIPFEDVKKISFKR
jgi:hypothetical protein